MSLSSILARTRIRSIKHSKFSKNVIEHCWCSTNVDEIEIPKRIPRGPTDILRALESTIGRDPTAAHFKYHDDPYLIPMSNVGKRTFAMAQESGRKAAHWIRREHADLFQHKEADPEIKMFFPPMIYNEKSNVSEQDLLTCISNGQVSDATTVYKLLKEKSISVSPQIEQGLLELLCFYNGEEPLAEDFIEERWFRQSSKGKERQRKTWSDGTLAEEIFIGMNEPSSEAYCALIQGMVKYFQIERAWQLFNEALEKCLILNTNTYNAIISVAPYLKENFDMRWAFVVNTLSDLNKANLSPNLGTLNAVLHTVSTMGGGQASKQSAMQTLSEFKRIGIEPSLASWYYILITCCKDRGPKSTILNDIINELENKEFKIKDMRDTHFFVTAMDICRYHLYDVELARRVDKLLHFGNNYDLIGDSYKESIYYRHYFILLCGSLPIDEFMNSIYETLVPNVYIPEPGVMQEILSCVEASGAIEYIPKLWSDMTVFDHTYRESLLELILNIMVNNEPLEENADQRDKFAGIGWDIFEKLTNQNENRTNKIPITGDVLGNSMILLARNKSFDKAWDILSTLDKGHHQIVGVPKIEALSLFVDLCIEQKAPSKAIVCIQYCDDIGHQEAENLAAKLNKELTLDETHIQTLTNIVGAHVFKTKENVK